MVWNLILKIASSLFYFALHVTPNGTFPPPLKAAEESDLLEKMHKGDIAARDKLIEHNLRLVAHIVKKYYTAENTEDLISIGTIGLIKAISTFKANKGIRLATYASRCIDNEILMHFRALKKTSQDVYISDPIDTDKDGNTLTLIDIISDDSDIIDDITVKIQLQKLKSVINDALDEREKTIICYRYGIGGMPELTQSQIAAQLNISRSYVSRIEKAALQKLRLLIE